MPHHPRTVLCGAVLVLLLVVAFRAMPVAAASQYAFCQPQTLQQITQFCAAYNATTPEVRTSLNQQIRMWYASYPELGIQSADDFCQYFVDYCNRPQLEPIVPPKPAPLPPLEPIPTPSPPLDRSRLEELDISEPEPVLDPLTMDQLDISAEAAPGSTPGTRVHAEGSVSPQSLQAGVEITLTIESEPIVRTIRPTVTRWVFDEVIPLAPGPHAITAVARDRTGRESPPVRRTFTVGPATAPPPASPAPPAAPRTPAILRVVRTFRADPQVQKTNQTIAAPTITTVAILNTAVAVGTAGVNATILLHYLASLFTEPFLLLTRRRRKPWGIVYHALSKRPVDLALVRLLDTESGTIRSTRVTDREGRFSFLPNPGSYRLTVTHPRYAFPSKYLKGKRTDSAYDDLYQGDPFSFSGKTDVITTNVPLDPKEELPTDATRAPGRPHGFHTAIAYLGPLLALGSFGISPTLPLGILLVVHVSTLFLFRRLAHPKRPKATGTVKDAETDQPIPHAVVRLFETTFQKLVDVQPTTRDGRYGFLVGPATFSLTVEKPGYTSATVDRIDGAKAKGVVAMDVQLGK